MFSRRLVGLALLWPLVVGAQTFGSAAPATGWPGSDTPFQPQVSRLSDGQVRVQFTVPPHHALYRERLRLTAANGWEVQPQWPQADTDAGGHAAFTHSFAVTVPVSTTDPSLPLQVKLTFQGCEVDVLCYPPQTQTFTLPSIVAQPTLVIIGQTGCKPCTTLNTRLKSPAVVKALKGWTVVEINASTAPESLARYGVTSFPSVRVFAQGDTVDARHGQTHEGILTEQQVLNLLRTPKPPTPVALALL